MAGRPSTRIKKKETIFLSLRKLARQQVLTGFLYSANVKFIYFFLIWMRPIKNKFSQLPECITWSRLIFRLYRKLEKYQKKKGGLYDKLGKRQEYNSIPSCSRFCRICASYVYISMQMDVFSLRRGRGGRHILFTDGLNKWPNEELLKISSNISKLVPNLMRKAQCCW